MTADQSAKKGRETPRRSAVRKTQRERAQALQDWLTDRLEAWRERRDAEPEPEVQPRHGMTRFMRNIPGPIATPVYRHKGPNREQRRHSLEGAGRHVFWPKDLQQPAVNVPAMNLARDLKPTRAAKLRKDLDVAELDALRRKLGDDDERD